MRCVAHEHETSFGIRGYWGAVADLPTVDFVCFVGHGLEERWQGTESFKELSSGNFFAYQAVSFASPCVGTKVLQLIAVFKVSIFNMFEAVRTESSYS